MLILSILAVVFVPVGFDVTIYIYRRQQLDSEDQRVAATIDVLNGVQKGLTEWGDRHFGGDGYLDAEAHRRAEDDYKAIVESQGNYVQNFRVPSEALVSVINHSDLIDVDTIKAANVALWKIGIFNQLVQQHTDFNARHITEYLAEPLGSDRREVLGRAAEELSYRMHRYGIEDAGWYKELKRAVDVNITNLEDRRRELQKERRRLWRSISRPALVSGQAALPSATSDDNNPTP